jgi:hypothetical protein
LDPNQISSVDLPGMDFVRNLAETLAEYGVDESDVFSINPGVLNFVRYLMSDIEELEAEVMDLRERTTQQAKDLKRVRAQRIALLFKLQRLIGTDELEALDLSQTTLRVIRQHHQDQADGAAD